jgi:hypothetical protein
MGTLNLIYENNFVLIQYRKIDCLAGFACELHQSWVSAFDNLDLRDGRNGKQSRPKPDSPSGGRSDHKPLIIQSIHNPLHCGTWKTYEFGNPAKSQALPVF